MSPPSSCHGGCSPPIFDIESSLSALCLFALLERFVATATAAPTWKRSSTSCCWTVGTRMERSTLTPSHHSKRCVSAPLDLSPFLSCLRSLTYAVTMSQGGGAWVAEGAFTTRWKLRFPLIPLSYSNPVCLCVLFFPVRLFFLPLPQAHVSHPIT